MEVLIFRIYHASFKYIKLFLFHVRLTTLKESANILAHIVGLTAVCFCYWYFTGNSLMHLACIKDPNNIKEIEV
jgi:uncharacterized membrane protein